MAAWVNEIFTGEIAPVFREFPLSVQEYAKQTSAEINFLFPKTPLTEAFLPLILTAYCMKRNKPFQKSEIESKEFLEALLPHDFPHIQQYTVFIAVPGFVGCGIKFWSSL